MNLFSLKSNTKEGISFVEGVINDFILAERQHMNKLEYMKDKISKNLHFSNFSSKPATQTFISKITKNLIRTITDSAKLKSEFISMLDMEVRSDLAAAQQVLAGQI